MAHRILRDLDAAEDAVQRALVDIWRDLPRLKDLDRFDAWTYRLVVRASLDEARQRRRHAHVRELPPDGPERTGRVGGARDPRRPRSAPSTASSPSTARWWCSTTTSAFP